MKQPDMSNQETIEEQIEAFLAGALSADDRARFESRLKDDPQLAEAVECQRAIDASLRRSFAVPEDLVFELPVSARATATPQRRFTVLRSFVGLLAAAAVVLLVLRLAAMEDTAVRPVQVDVSTLVADVRNPEQVDSPNLERLYLDAAGQEAQSQCSGPGDLNGLERELLERYGPGITVKPEASGLIHGPFRSDEWPSGTVLTSYPDGPMGQPVVLVAEEESQLACCLDVSLPQSSDLQMFTWKFGSLLVTEITPHRESRMMSCFEPDS